MTLADVVLKGNSISLRNLATDRKLATEIQNRLINLGCLDAPADGSFGPVSNFVLNEYGKQMGLELDNDEETLDIGLLESLLEVNEEHFIPLTLGNDLASRIIRYMQIRGYWIAKLPGFLNIVYIEGVNEDGSLNADKFNEFNDRRMVIVIEDGKPKILFNALATTEPGKHFTENPMNRAGAARIAFGQYKAWRIGIHLRTKPSGHEALVQVGELSVHRDSNRDTKRNFDPIDVGSSFGINQHSGHDAPANDIGRHSAGCLVCRSHGEHKQFMRLIKTDRRFVEASSGYTYISTIIAGDDLLQKVSA